MAGHRLICLIHWPGAVAERSAVKKHLSLIGIGGMCFKEANHGEMSIVGQY